MVGGGTFILLNAGCPRPESAKQTEIRLASLLKMLQIAHFGTEQPSPGVKRTFDGRIHRYFLGLWLIHPELFLL
jgi:hypothetical protein